MELNSFKEHRANQSMSRAGDKPNFGNILFLVDGSARSRILVSRITGV